MPRNPSLRDLAKRLGVSHTTVAEALRDHPRVNADTRERVKKAAAALGYRRNALAGAIMSEVRRNRVDKFQGTIAVLDLNDEPIRPEHVTRFYREITAGAAGRIAEMGFKMDMIAARAEGIRLPRLHDILKARGIRGLFLLPMPQEPDLAAFDWSGFSSIYADYVIQRPGLHSVCPDHYRGMLTVLDQVRALGYRRPGLVLQTAHDARLLHRWEAAFLAHQKYRGGTAWVEPLAVDFPGERDFKRWFRPAKCDVVIAHNPEVRRWMADMGARVPETHGFCCLNLINSAEPCAGLDLLPRLLGERGVDQLVGQLMRGEVGVPARPMTTTIQPDWVGGPTVRRVAGADAPAESDAEVKAEKLRKQKGREPRR